MKYLHHISKALIILAVFFLSACATTRYPVYDVERDELKRWFEEARTLVEQERRMDLGDVALSSVTGREMLFVLSDLYGKKLDPNMTADTRIRVFSDKAFDEVKSIQAVYDPFAKRIVINQQNLQYYIGLLTDRGIDPRDAAMTLLIHELVHAADDKEYDLVAIEKRHTGDTLGVFIVAEGHAEMQTESICAKAGCSEAFRLAQIVFHGADPHDTDQTLLTSQDNHGLVYVQGRNFLKALADRDSTLTKPPGDVLEFFDPASFPNKVRSQRREKIYQILNSVEIDSVQGPLLKIPQSVFNESDVPANRHARLQYVQHYKQKTLASGSMNYVEQYDQDLNTIYVRLYEASSSRAAHEIRQQLIKDRLRVTRDLKSLGADLSHPKGAELSAMSEGLPPKTQRYVVDFKSRKTGEKLQLISTYLIEGRHLIVVSNSDNSDVNLETLLKVRQKLRAP